MSSVEDQVKAIITEQLGAKEEEVTNDNTLAEAVRRRRNRSSRP